ncbi:hypothetical protein IKF21_00005, partial [Candidatus Saccharibacteria bacterium]|nr:hypothetical protein [Candidatus Saccharibacteria bacterium]
SDDAVYNSEYACVGAGHTSEECAHYHAGNYYNLAAAIASNSAGSLNSSYATANNDICPKGWRLPKGKASTDTAFTREFSQLFYSAGATTSIDATGYATGGLNTIRNNPMFFVRGGYINGSALNNRANYGYYWTGSTYNSEVSYYTYFYSSGLNSDYINIPSWSPATPNRYNGYSVRCLSETPSYTTTVNFAGTGITSVTLTNGADTKTVTTSGSTVSLKQSATYRVTATLATGYEFDSWATTAGGVLGSTSTNPATYKVNGDTTLTATGQEAPSYSVTVNFDSNVSSIGFYNPDLGTQQVTTSGDIVTLKRGVKYTVSSSYSSGYVADQWTTTTGGTFSSLTNNATTYVTNGTTTIDLDSREATNMQDLTLTACQTLASSDYYMVKDSRDNSTYPVRYIAGGCWMTQNLRITGTVSATDSNFTGNDYNVSAYSLASADSSYSGHCNGSNGYNYACAKDSGDIIKGVWYNYTSVTAGTITGSSNSNVPTQDICPAGWHLPSSGSGSSGSVNNLLSYKNQFAPVEGGYYTDSGQLSYLNDGYWWTTGVYSDTGRYNLGYYNRQNKDILHVGGITEYSNACWSRRFIGVYARCVLTN